VLVPIYTLKLTKRLETAGLTRAQAEAIAEGLAKDVAAQRTEMAALRAALRRS
jgi:hypothetical protein